MCVCVCVCVCIYIYIYGACMYEQYIYIKYYNLDKLKNIFKNSIRNLYLPRKELNV